MRVRDAFESYWFAEHALEDIQIFRQRCAQTGQEFVERRRVMDFGGMRSVIRKIVWVEEYVTHEPFASQWDSLMAFCLITLADAAQSQLWFQEVILALDDARRVLEAKNRRRVSLQLDPRPDSVSWTRLLCVLGDVKWRGPAELRDAILTPEEMAERLLAIESRTREMMSALKYKPEERETQRYSQRTAGLHISKTLLRFTPARGEQFLVRLDELYGGAFSNPERFYYWDIQIARRFFAGTLTPDVLAELSQKRHAVCINEPGLEMPSRAYETDIAAENAQLLSLMRASRFTVEEPVRTP